MGITLDGCGTFFVLVEIVANWVVMMQILRTVWFVIAGVLLANSALGETKYYPPTTPWHLADIWWTARDETKNFSSLSIDFEVIGQTDAGYLLYIAPIGLGKLNEVSFYGGIQTNSGGWKTKDSRTIVKFGKGGIFSRWSATGQPIGLDYADGNATTHYESAGYEGNFVSVRNKFDWNEGRYRYEIRKLNSIEQNGEVYTWFGAYLYDYGKKAENYIGSLKFSGSSFTYGKKHAAFVEIYGRKHGSEIPQVTVIFHEPRINNALRALESTTVYYPQHNMDAPPRFAYTQPGEHKMMVMTLPAGLTDGKTKEIYPAASH